MTFFTLFVNLKGIKVIIILIFVKSPKAALFFIRFIGAKVL